MNEKLKVVLWVTIAIVIFSAAHVFKAAIMQEFT